MMKITFALSASMAAGLFFYGEPIIRILFSSSNFSPGDFSHAGKALFIMSSGAAIGLPQFISIKMLQGIGEHWKVTQTTIIISVLALISGIVAIYFGLGIYGAVLGWSLFWTLQGILFYPSWTSRHFNQPVPEMLFKTYIPGTASFIFVLILSLLVSLWLVPDNAANLIMGLIICLSSGMVVLIMVTGQARLVYLHLAEMKSRKHLYKSI